MKGARSAQSRPYWIRYVVAFWAVEKLTWAKDNVLIACVCSLAPGLIAAGISAALSDDKWLAATPKFSNASMASCSRGTFKKVEMWFAVLRSIPIGRFGAVSEIAVKSSSTVRSPLPVIVTDRAETRRSASIWLPIGVVGLFIYANPPYSRHA